MTVAGKASDTLHPRTEQSIVSRHRSSGGRDDPVALMREAVELHLKGLREDGLPLPAPHAIGDVTVTTAA